MPAPPEIRHWQTDDFLDEIEAYGVAHAGLDALDARELCRSVWQGERLHLPAAQNDAGRAEKSRLEAAIVAAIAPMVPDAVAATSTAAPTASPPLAQETNLPTLSIESRRVIFRQMAGPRLSAFASALAETTATVDEAASAIAVARAGLAPEKPAASGPHPGVWWRQPEFQSDGMGGDLSPMTTKADTVKKAWAKAFSKVQGRETL